MDVKDICQSIINFSSCSDINNMRLLNTTFNNNIKNLKVYYQHKKLEEIWGKPIFKLISKYYDGDFNKMFDKFKKKNHYNRVEIIKYFYKAVIQDKINLHKEKLFLPIYDIHFITLNSAEIYDGSAEIYNEKKNNFYLLYKYRNDLISKNYSNENFDEIKDINIKSLLYISKYIEKYIGKYI